MLIQQITPDVLQWIAAQAQAGHKPEAVVDAMRASGWNEDVALAAIQRLKGGRVVPAPPPVVVPEPDSTDLECVIRTSDREVQVLASVRSPRVMVLGSLLSDEECDSLIELARNKL